MSTETRAPCLGMNCGTTTNDHSLECHAEHQAAIAGGNFVKTQPMLSRTEWILTMHTMRTPWATTFVRALGEAGLYADEQEQRRIHEAFPEIIAAYGPGSSIYNSTCDIAG